MRFPQAIRLFFLFFLFLTVPLHQIHAAPSGQDMPVGDIPGWHQIFTDDFPTNVPLGGFSGCVASGGILNSTCSGLPSDVKAKWFAYPDTWPDTYSGNYYPSKVMSIQNGIMNLYLHTENGIHMVAAPYPKIPGGVNNAGFYQARYVIRFRSDPLPGYKVAWLLWPDTGVWPKDGEVDFPEGTLTGNICAFMHRQDATVGSDQDAFCSTTPVSSGWHTAIIERTSSQINFILDGLLLGRSTSRLPTNPMHWVIQTETASDTTPPADSVAGNVQIDWVAVYVPSTTSPTPTPTRTPTPSPRPTSTPTPIVRPSIVPTSSPVITNTPVTKSGDANGDGLVNGIDYVIWLNHYNQTTTRGSSDGDFNGSGKVDGVDYVMWLTNYGQSTATPTTTPTSSSNPTVRPTPTNTPFPLPTTAPTVTPSITNLLTWRPPTLTNPVVKNITAPGNISLDPNTDYTLKFPTTPLNGAMAITGGRNVTLIGGEINIPTQPGSPPTISSRRALKIADTTGTIHIEGLLMRGVDISEGIQIYAPLATIQLQNIRIEHLHARDQVGFTDNHPDCIQPDGGYKELRVDSFTCSTDYQGLFMSNNYQTLGKTTIRRTNIIGDPTAHYLFWLLPSRLASGATFTLDNVWVDAPASRTLTNSVCYFVNGSCPNFLVTSIDSSGRPYATWPNTVITGRVTEGLPPTGDFAKSGKVGTEYTSPGYQ